MNRQLNFIVFEGRGESEKNLVQTLQKNKNHEFFKKNKIQNITCKIGKLTNILNDKKIGEFTSRYTTGEIEIAVNKKIEFIVMIDNDVQHQFNKFCNNFLEFKDLLINKIKSNKYIKEENVLVKILAYPFACTFEYFIASFFPDFCLEKRITKSSQSKFLSRCGVEKKDYSTVNSDVSKILKKKHTGKTDEEVLDNLFKTFNKNIDEMNLRIRRYLEDSETKVLLEHYITLRDIFWVPNF